MKIKQLKLPFPDDWHCHLRDGELLSRTVADMALHFKRAVVMPNLVPPITTVAEAMAYRARILQHIPKNCVFDPRMVLYFSRDLKPDEIDIAKKNPHMHGVKLYPHGVTTHSDSGIMDLKNLDPIFEAMQSADFPLLIHGEVSDPSVDIFDRELVFIKKELTPLIKRFPKLRIVLEHISTKAAVEFIKSAPSHIGATITVHHLLFNRNDLLSGRIRPHLYCLPILKRREDQMALLEAAMSGNPHFFLGTDSAPHAQSQKECSHGCAGIYSAPVALALLAHIFEQYNAMEQLASFTSKHGAIFYNLAPNLETLTLYKKNWTVPESLVFGSEKIISLAAGQILNWQVSHD